MLIVTPVFFVLVSTLQRILPHLRLLIICLSTILISIATAQICSAQQLPQTSNVPNFWDPNVRLVKPDGFKIKRLRFLTTTDFPPFNFIDRNKKLSGFHVDIARQICSELAILPLCQIQALPWNELDQAIEKGNGEAIIAGLEMTLETKKKYDFSMPFMHVPARFVALHASILNEPMAKSLFKKKTALVSGSAHANYFKAVFSNRKYLEFDTLAQAQKALLEKKVDVLFADAVSSAFWLTSKVADKCCKFVGGPYISREYFGNGLTIAIAKGNTELVEAINFALRRINDNGTFREFYLRYFPLSLY